MPDTTTVPRERSIIMQGESVRAILSGRKTQTRRVVTPQPVKDGRFWRLFGAGWSDNVTSVPCVPGHSLARRNPYGAPGDRLWCREAWQADLLLPSAAEVEGTAIGNLPWWHEAPPMYRGLSNVGMVYYRATGTVLHSPDPDPESGCVGTAEQRAPSADSAAASLAHLRRWLSPRWMPRWASRLTLEITEVRVERLQEITPPDVFAEGIQIPVVDGNPALSLSADGPAKYLDRGFSGDDFIRAHYAAQWDHLNATRGFPWDANPWVWVIAFRPVEDAHG